MSIARWGRLLPNDRRSPPQRAILGQEAKLCRAALLDRGYFVSTVGRDEEVIREYIRHQEGADRRIDQMNLTLGPL